MPGLELFTRVPRITPMRRTLATPPVFLLGCLVSSLFLQLTWPRAIASYSFPTAMAGGSSLLLLAGILSASGLRELRRHRTTFEPGRTPSHLVTSGPYRFSRNPMYVALVLLHAAIAIMANSLWLAAGAAGLWLSLDRFVIPREETVIRQSFGEDYVAYTARVRRWL